MLTATDVLNDGQMEESHRLSMTKAISLYKNVLFGLLRTFDDGLSKLRTDIGEIYPLFKDENSRKVEERCK